MTDGRVRVVAIDDSPLCAEGPSASTRGSRMILREHLRAVEKRLGARPPERSIDEELSDRVAERVRALGLPSVEAYLSRVGRALDEELPHLASPFTNGWTWFFRDAEPLETLATRFSREPRSGPISIWVAGCSTGEEAYGAAMIFLDHGVDVRVIATDVDLTRLREAELATYGPASLRRVAPEVLARHFERLDEGRARVRRSVRDLVELRVHNLLDAPLLPPRAGTWDVIVCRNVLLHLEPPVASSVQRRLETSASRHLLFGPADVLPRMRTMFRPPSSPPIAFPPRPSIPPAPDASERWALVGELVRVGALARARAALLTLLEEWPDHGAARLTLGNLFVELHAFDEAECSYRRVEDVDPCCPELHFLWGTLHRKRGAWGAAAASLRRALFHDARFWPARFLLAGVWERTGEPERARRGLEETLAALDERPRIVWRSHVDAIASIACPPAAVRAACLRRLGREREIEESKGA